MNTMTTITPMATPSKRQPPPDSICAVEVLMVAQALSRAAITASNPRRPGVSEDDYDASVTRLVNMKWTAFVDNAEALIETINKWRKRRT